MGINLMVLEVEEFNSEVKNDLGGRLTSEAMIRYCWFLQGGDSASEASHVYCAGAAASEASGAKRPPPRSGLA